MTDFTDDLKDMSHDEIHKRFIEYSRVLQRIKKYGDPNVVKKVGRKCVSPEHKKATYERTLARKKEQRIQKAIDEGRVYALGRPVKILPTTIPV